MPDEGGKIIHPGPGPLTLDQLVERFLECARARRETPPQCLEALRKAARIAAPKPRSS